MADGGAALSPAKRALLAKLRAGGGPRIDSIRPTTSEGPFELSYGQERIWFTGQLGAENLRLFNLAAAGMLPFEVVPSMLEERLAGIAARHDALRMSIAVSAGTPAVRVAESVSIEVPFTDLSGLPVDGDAGVAELATRVALDIATRPYDLSRPPLWRAELVRLPGGQQMVVIAAHHMVLDGVSLAMFIDELGGAERPVPVRFVDFVAWQRARLAEGAFNGELAYWMRQLADLPAPLELPADRQRPAEPTLEGATISVGLSAETVAVVRDLARATGVTPYITMLAAFATLLHRWTGERDIVVGAPVSGRTRPETANLFGMCVNTLVLRTSFAGMPTFYEVLDRTRQVAGEAFSRQNVPYEFVVRELRRRGATSVPPVTVCFNWPIESVQIPSIPVSLPISPEGSQFDLTAHVVPDVGGALRILFEYSADLFDEATVHGLLDQYLMLLTGLTEAPETRVSRVPLLRPADSAAMPAAPTPVEQPVTLPELVRKQAGTDPGAVAIDGGCRLTYADVLRLADRVADWLRDHGVRKGDPVGVRLARGPELVVAVLGAWGAGAVYVPIDPTLPDSRIETIIDDVGAQLVLDTDTVTEATREVRSAIQSDGVPLAVRPTDPAYVIYTSGSTGRPKGAVVTHAGIANRVRWAVREYEFGSADRMLHKTRIGFDAHVWELFAPLVSGGTVVMAPEGAESDPETMLGAVAEHGVTVLQVVPSVLRLLVEVETQWADCDRLRLLFCAGEPLPSTLCRRVGTLSPTLRIVNTYGPTECAIDVTAYEVGGDVSDDIVPIGRPISGIRAYVLDEYEEPVPDGVPGELCVAGVGVGLGYHCEPGLTAAVFRPNPLGPAGSRLYHTGDRVRRGSDGLLRYLGRADRQVKINGVRVELGEVETVLAEHPGVLGAAVVLRPDDRGGSRLVGYVTGSVGAYELREYLRKCLPAPMIPAVIVRLDTMPHTLGGKPDLAALPAPADVPLARSYVPPRTPVEQVVAESWAEVLDLERVGLTDDFFSLGGHSLLVGRLARMLGERLDVDVPLNRLLGATTVADQARLVGGARRSTPIDRVDRGVPLPVSSGQRRLWFLDRFSPEKSQYLLPRLFRLQGTVAPAELRDAFGQVLARHEILRTRYVELSGELRQVVDAAVEPSLTMIEATHAELADVLAAEIDRPFDLEHGPVLRALLVRLAPDEHLLAICVHHIAADAWSMEVLCDELFAAYRGVRLQPLELQYGDYATWEQTRLGDLETAEQIDYWRERLADVTPTELPTDRPRPRTWTGRGAVTTFTVPADVGRRLVRLGRDTGATPFMTFLAAFSVLLARYADTEDVVVGTPVAGRLHPATEPLIGFFVNTLVLRLDVRSEQPFRELLSGVRSACLGAYAHQELPFEQMIEALRPGRDTSRNPMFQIMFEYGPGDEGAGVPVADGFSAEPIAENTPWRSAKFDLTVGLADRGDGAPIGYVEYATDLFDADSIDRLIDRYLRVLEAVSVDPTIRSERLDLLTAAERRRLVGSPPTLPGSLPSSSNLCVHEAFLAQAQTTPDAVAVVHRDGAMSYARVVRRAGVLAAKLRRRGVGLETPVVVCARRGAGVVVALLAVLWAGGMYVPIDPDGPVERTRSLIADAGPGAIVLTDDDLDAAVTEAESESGQVTPPGSDVDPANLAYVIYTSGSTGRPKGVMIDHRAYLRHCQVIARQYDIRPGDRVALSSSLVFDVAMDQMMATLLAGATVVVAGPGRADPGGLLGWLAEQRITHLEITPAHYREMMAGIAPGDRRLSALRLMNVGSDLVTYRDAGRWYTADMPGAFLCNYGPTECTVTCMLHPVGEVEATAHRPEQSVPIGLPVPGTRAYVLDRTLSPTLPGVPGELYLGGVRLARGYLRRPGLTAERFVPDPFGDDRGGRLYRTGDLVRHRDDGVIEFLGRLDTQVKIRGFRIELGEIEATLAAHPDVRAAAVVVYRGGGEPELAAYVVLDGQAEQYALRDHLTARLPDYMIPSYWTPLPELPLNSSGKVDRRALPTPVRLRREYAPPETAVERQIVDIWAEVFGAPTDAIGRHDDFFTIGGHSLRAARVHTRIREYFAVEFPLRALFEATTVADLATVVTGVVEAEIAALSDEDVTVAFADLEES